MLNDLFYRKPIYCLLIAGGAAIIILSIFGDMIGIGHQGFGRGQLSGVVFGTFFCIAVLLHVNHETPGFLARLAGTIYVGGILYMGLRPSPDVHNRYKILLNLNSFSLNDFAINTIGFIPLGYLLMLCFTFRPERRESTPMRRIIIIIGAGVMLSLLLEVAQYYLPWGRESSFMDLTANAIGTFIGVTAFLFTEHERNRSIRT